ncbi:MAG: cytochrome c biogenesis protein CcdA, partial [Bacteroidota bacterium]
MKWSYDKKKLSDTEYLLIFKANIETTWHLYSQITPPPPDGPLPTVFTIKKSKDFALIGKTTEPNTKSHYDPVFEQNIKSFDKEAVFTQKIKVLSNKPFTITGMVEFQACDESKCTSGDDEFSFSLEGSKTAVADNTQAATTAAVVAQAAPATPQNADTSKESAKEIQKVELKSAQASPYEKINKSLWTLFFFSFLAGLAAILTPCVFPMIPMTVSYFMKDKHKAKAKLEALVFSASIVAIYTIIGTLVAVTLGANFANFLSTHWIPNVLFFLIFLIFAASFFGMFEITLPSWMINSSDKQVDKGGLLGSFFMAFTLVLVSFSCTGPIVGAILVASAGGKLLEPIIGMFGFACHALRQQV